jgi:hypothetical protein
MAKRCEIGGLVRWNEVSKRQTETAYAAQQASGMMGIGIGPAQVKLCQYIYI